MVDPTAQQPLLRHFNLPCIQVPIIATDQSSVHADFSLIMICPDSVKGSTPRLGKAIPHPKPTSLGGVAAVVSPSNITHVGLCTCSTLSVRYDRGMQENMDQFVIVETHTSKVTGNGDGNGAPVLCRCGGAVKHAEFF